MHIDQARALKAALANAIAAAEQSGNTEVDLQGSLDTQLGEALDEAQQALDEQSGG